MRVLLKPLSADTDTINDSAVRDGRNDDGSYDWRNDNRSTHCNCAIWSGASRPHNATGAHDRIGFVGDQGCDTYQNCKYKRCVVHFASSQ
jgi:hypothetical protein